MGIIVNGHLYDYGNAEIRVENTLYNTITEVSYSQKLEPGVLRGSSPMPLGYSRGTYEVTNASFSIYKEDYMRMVKQLAALTGGGYMESIFEIAVSYTPVGAFANEPILDTLSGCRIKSDEDSHSSGNDPLIVKAELNVYKLLRDGIAAVSGQGLLADSFIPGVGP